MGAACVVAVVMMMAIVIVELAIMNNLRFQKEVIAGLSPTSKPRSFSSRCKERIMTMSTVIPTKEDIGNPRFWQHGTRKPVMIGRRAPDRAATEDGEV